MRIPAIDLFCGAGGLSLGLTQAGFEIKASVEIDKEAISTYKRNIGDVIIEKDIRNVSGSDLLAKSKIKENELFVLAGCPPCQGFSNVGPQDKDDIRNELVFEYVRLIKELKPWFILMENVPGMSKGVGKEIFKKVCDDLGENFLIHFDILNAANYGVPQNRKRLVLHGVRKDIYKKYFPNGFELTNPPITHSETPFTNNIKEVCKVSIIKDLLPINAGEKHKEIPNHQCMSLSELNLKRIRRTPINGGSRDAWPDELVLECHKKNVGYKDVYGRMNMDCLAPTLTAGCLSYSKGRFGHPTQDRAISAREAARLQTFPDDYVFEGSLGSIGKQIGNAVPPKLAEASGRYLLGLIDKYIRTKILIY